jgi:hypothetical protein
VITLAKQFCDGVLGEIGLVVSEDSIRLKLALQGRIIVTAARPGAAQEDRTALKPSEHG